MDWRRLTLGIVSALLLIGAGCSSSLCGAPSEPPSTVESVEAPPSEEVEPRPPVEPLSPAEVDASVEPPPDPEPIVIDPSEYAEVTVPIEDPHGSMAHFYERLASVARDEPGTLARISIYSDSVNGTDLVSSALRHAMAKRFGDGGKGWIPIGKGWPTQFHRDVVWRNSNTWVTRVVNRGGAPEDRYGLGGVLSINRSRHSTASYATLDEGPVNRTAARFRLFYQAWPHGGAVQVVADEGEPVDIATEAEEVEDRVYDLEVADGPHEFEVRAAEGRLRLYGVVMESAGPGVVVDGLMLIGARARRLVNFDGDHFGRQLVLRQTDLLILWMGGNDAESSYFSAEGFVEDYAAGIANARRGYPEASCLVASVMDIGEVSGGQTRRRVPRLVELQRQLALDHGCAFFNVFEAMGGEGSARTWFRSSPRLISGDYLHPTPEGAEVMGLIFHRTLIHGLAQHLGRAAPIADSQTDGVGSVSGSKRRRSQ